MFDKKWQICKTTIVNDRFYGKKMSRIFDSERDTWNELGWILEGFFLDYEMDRVLRNTVGIEINQEAKEVIVSYVDSSALRDWIVIYKIES